MNSTVFSSVSLIGGSRRAAWSVPEARRFVSCFPVIRLTTRSMSREWIPMNMPS